VLADRKGRIASGPSAHQSNLRLLYVLMYEHDALDQLRDKYRFAPLLVNIDSVRAGE